MKSITRNIYYAIARLYYKMSWSKFTHNVTKIRQNGIEPIFIFGTPIHRNIGDLAIGYAEERFVDAMDGYCAVSLSVPFIEANRSKIKDVIEQNDILIGHGGGNLGDTYPQEEDVRRFMIQGFPENRILIFPQTIFFSDTEEGREFAKESAKIYGEHANLTIIAREQVSFDLATKTFANNKVILTPDIVLSLEIQQHKQTRNGVLICLRNDVEKTLNDNAHNNIALFAKDISETITITDTISSDRFFILKKKSTIVKKKLRQFSGAELIITDRLHGMVFAAITGTPCLVFSNFNHKVSGTYAWIKDLDCIQFCSTVDDLQSVNINGLMEVARSHNPNTFDNYWTIIQSLIADRKNA